MPTPRRSRRFGSSASHQRLMMANLAASLFAAEAITTSEAKAKHLRPIAEKLITKAKKAQEEGPMQVHRIRQIQSFLGDKEMTYKLVHDVAPRQRRAKWWLHPYSQDRSPRRRQRPDGADRTRLSETLGVADTRNVRFTSRTMAPTSTVSPRATACARCWERSVTPSRPSCGAP